MLSLLKVEEDPMSILLTVDCTGMPPIPQRRLTVLHEHWATGFKWLIKMKLGVQPDDFNPRRKLEQGLKPFGQRLTLLYELCIQLHALEVGSHKHSSAYKNGSEWFQAVARELWREDVGDCLHGDPELPGKWALRRQIAKHVKVLREDENPIDPTEQPHCWRLFEAAINTAGQFPAFQRAHWNPYLMAWSSQAKGLESANWKSWNCVEGKIGKGKRNRKKDRPLEPSHIKGLQL